MALDPEELKRRRRAREAQREKQRRQWRKTLFGILAAGVILAVSITVILLSRKADPAPTEPVSSSEQTQPSGELSAETTTVRLAFAGDLNVNDKVISASGDGYDYSRAFLDVIPLLADADVTALNFEGNLSGSPYGSESHSAPPGLMTALDAAGVDLIQLANSYSLSKGVSGLSDTIDAIRSAGMEPLGVYAEPEQYNEGKGFTIVEVGGMRIAYVAFTKGMDGTTLPPGKERCVNVLYTDYNSTYQQIDTEGITAILADVQAQDPDFVVAMLHWGSEYNDTVSASQKKICSLMEENGVDAVIGSHPHYLHSLSQDPETGFFVAYSLGDFLGDAQRAGTEYSIILELTVTRDNVTGETRLAEYSYTPIFISTEGEARVLRLQEAVTAYENGYIDRVSQGEYEKMKYALGRIEDRVTPEPTDEEE